MAGSARGQRRKGSPDGAAAEALVRERVDPICSPCPLPTCLGPVSQGRAASRSNAFKQMKDPHFVSWWPLFHWSDCGFRSCRPVISLEVGHPFRSMPAGQFGRMPPGCGPRPKWVAGRLRIRQSDDKIRVRAFYCVLALLLASLPHREARQHHR